MAKSRKPVPPTNDEELLAFSTNLYQYAAEQTTGTKPAWPHVPLERLQPLSDAHLDFKTAFDKYMAVKTTENCRAKNDRKAVLRALITTFLNDYVRKNSHVTPADIDALMMSPPDTTHTVINVPVFECVGEADYPARGRVRMYNFHPPRALTPAEELSMHGVRVAWGVLGPPTSEDRLRLTEVPRTGKDLPHSNFTRRSSYTIDVTNDSGLKLYASMCYENSKGEAGPFGPIIEVIIP